MFIICAHWKAHFDISMLSMTSYINCYLIWSFGLLFCASQMIESARCCYPEDKHLTIFQTFSFNCVSIRLPSEGGKCKDPPCLGEPLHHLYTEALFVMCLLLWFPLGLYALTWLVLRLGGLDVNGSSHPQVPPSLGTQRPLLTLARSLQNSYDPQAPPCSSSFRPFGPWRPPCCFRL